MSALGLAAAAPATDPTRLAWTAAVLAWILAVPMFYVTKFALVVTHEGGHALMGKVLFQGVDSITFSRDGGGATTPSSPPPWLFSIFILLAGYLGPSMFGVFAAWLLVRGRTEIVLWGSLAFLLVMLIAVRGLLGWLIVPCLMVLIGLVAVKVEPPLQTLLTHLWVWFLLIAAVQRMIIFMTTKTYEVAESDAGRLRDLTMLPRELWGVVFLLGTMAALVYGGVMLLQPGT